MHRARIWLDLERLIKARDRGLIIAGVEVEQRAAVGCFEAARVGLKCLVETEPGLMAALLLHQKLAEPVPLPGGSRLQHQAPVVAPDRVVDAALERQDGSEVEKIFGD